jgi:heme/copper-type cytochrome/quinol oxidase subunit 3
MLFAFSSGHRRHGPGPRPGDRRPEQDPAGFGFGVFLVSWGVMFTCMILGFSLLLWRRGYDPEILELPFVLWPATVAALLSPLLTRRALRDLRRGDDGLRSSILLALLAAVLLMGLEIFAVYLVSRSHGFGIEHMLVFAFYCLLGLHILHAGIGLITLAWVSLRAWRGRYCKDAHRGLRVCSMYQGFVAVTWLAVFGMLWAHRSLG